MRGLFLLCALLLVVAPWPAAAQTPEAAQAAADELSEAAAVARERAALMARLERLKAETEATEARRQRLGEAVIDLTGDEARLRQRLEEASANVQTLEERIAREEEALEQLTVDQATIRHELAGRREELALVLMALQRIGRRPPPGLVGEGDDPMDAVRGAISLNAVVPALSETGNRLARKLSQASRFAAEERTRWERLAVDLQTVSAERERLDGLVQELERKRTLSLYDRDRAAADLARLAEEADSVNALIARLDSGPAQPPTADEGPAFALRKGRLAAPVAGTVVSRYGEQAGASSVADGRVIAALPQSTVFSPMPASVLFAGPFRSFGHVLILDAGDGYHMVLAGLAQTNVEPGQRVSTGMPLGRMAKTGGRASLVPQEGEGSAVLGGRPSLYVELRKDGAAIDSHGWWREPGVDGERTSG